MRWVLSRLTLISWGIWFGGMAALVVFVSTLFATDRATAMVAAPKLFMAFERVQLVVAALALIACAGWRLREARVALTALFTLLVLSAIGVVVSATMIRPQLDRLREQGNSSGPEFKRLHKASERVYGAQALLLLVAGVILPAALSSPRKADAAAPPTAPPV